jgi:hypothetical protein
MSHADRTAIELEPVFHPVTHYDSPEEVLNDARLSIDEKRVILSSWASDTYAVDSQPTLREIPGIPRRLRLEDILGALKRLDDDNDPPPRGGLAMRLPRFSEGDGAFSEAPCFIDGRRAARGFGTRRFPHPAHRSRWTREDNVRRYRKLLNTPLTDTERNFIERRLAEELRG